jgi:hypothetical protein
LTGKLFIHGAISLNRLAGCSDWYRPDYFQQLAESGSVARNPQGPESPSIPPSRRRKARPQRRSFLYQSILHPLYGWTRGKGEVNTGTNHLGFRCVQAP